MYLEKSKQITIWDGGSTYQLITVQQCTHQIDIDNSACDQVELLACKQTRLCNLSLLLGLSCKDDMIWQFPRHLLELYLYNSTELEVLHRMPIMPLGVRVANSRQVITFTSRYIFSVLSRYPLVRQHRTHIFDLYTSLEKIQKKYRC